VRQTRSASAQGILLAEGIVDRRWALDAGGPQLSATLDLVAFFKQTAESGGPGEFDRTALASLADHPRSGSFAARLARTILSRSSR
jgi:hypothetical protein